ncbi:MAG: transcriptional repressor [Fimbriimonadaceae bacterium]|nr:transcriptional repressor [Fimbriimonadaceae bacterium]
MSPGAPVPATFRDRAIQALRDAEMRITGPRLEVVKVLMASEVALSPNEIHTRVLESGGRMDAVSVYRVLSVFVRLGLVHHLASVDGYLACRLEHSHGENTHHIVCRNCGRVQEVALPEGVLEETLRRAIDQGFQDVHMHLEAVADRCVACP